MACHMDDAASVLIAEGTMFYFCLSYDSWLGHQERDSLRHWNQLGQLPEWPVLLLGFSGTSIVFALFRPLLP